MATEFDSVTTHTIMSATYPSGGTWSVSSTVRETLGGALDHVNGLFEDYPNGVTVGGTKDGRMIRYARAYRTESGSVAHDMVIIVRH